MQNDLFVLVVDASNKKASSKLKIMFHRLAHEFNQYELPQKPLSEEELSILSKWADELLPILQRYTDSTNYKKLAPKFKIKFS